MINFHVRLKNFLHNQKSVQRLLLYFLIVLIFFGAFSKPDFATDTYAYALGDFSEITNNFLRCGRIFTAGIYTILRLLSINISLINFACFIVATISLTFALYFLEKLLRKNFISNQLWSFLLPIILLINPFIIEYFLFIEKGIMCFCILLCVLSAQCYANYLDHRKRTDLFKVLLLNVFATFWYQGVIGLFIVLATMLTVTKAKQWLLFLKDTVISIGLYIIGPLINVMMIKLFFADGRTSGGLNVIEAAKMVAGSLDRMFSIFGIIPPIIFWGYFVIIVITWLIYLFRHHEFHILPCVQVFYLAFVVFLAAVVPQLVLDPDSVWIAPRAVYPFATIIGVSIVLIFHASPKFPSTNPSKSFLLFTTCCFVSIQFVGFNNIILDHYSLAELDRLRAGQIGNLISAYEAASGIEVKYITPSSDQNKTYTYNGIKSVADSNISAFSTYWSDVTSLNFWNKRSFVRKDPDPKWQAYCSSHDWDTFDTTQLSFVGDTLQICWP